MSLRQQESSLISTILVCCEKMNELMESNTLKLDFDNKTYFYDFKTLYCDINQIEFDHFYNKSLNESVNNLLLESDRKYTIPNSEVGNNYAYFKKVYNYIDGYSNDVIKNLNESLEIGKEQLQSFSSVNKVSDVKTPNIDSFKSELLKVIKRLENQNDTELPNDILKIKIDLNKQVNVFGFNINKNLKFVQTLENKFGQKSKDIHQIFYDKTNKFLYVIGKDENVLVYDIKKDIVENFNDLFVTEKITNDIKLNNIATHIKENVCSNIIPIYMCVDDLKFKDNLYKDVAFREYFEKRKTHNIK